MNEPSSNAPQTESGKAPSLWHRKKKLIIIIAAVVAVLLVAGIVAALMMRKDNPSGNSNQGNRTDRQLSDFAADYKDVCKDREVSFDNAPLAMDTLGYIIPMGQMSDGHVTPTDHVYLAPAVQSVPDNTYDVFMPAKGTVVAVSAMPAQYIGDKNQQTAPEDHRLVIAHNCQYYSIFIHIHQLSDALKQAVGTLQPNESKMVNVELNAGDKLGKIGGSPFDWSLLDVNKRLTGFITPSLYKGENWKIHVIDPLTVYTGTLRDQLIAKSLRGSEPYGGKIDYDVRGALVGNWFQEGTNGYEGASMDRYWDGHLSVVPDHIDPKSTVVSIGNWEGKAAQMAVKGKVDPATVTKTTGPVKYELMSISYLANGKRYLPNYHAKDITQSQDGTFKGTIMFEVGDNEHLKVETFPGKTAAQVSGFTNAAKTYVR
jgi:hypothetical protein